MNSILKTFSAANSLLLLLVVIPSHAQSTAETAEGIKRELDGIKAEFVATLQSTAANPEKIQSGQTQGDCEQILAKLDALQSRINEASDLLAKRETDLSAKTGISQADQLELKQALQNQRKPLESSKQSANKLESELKSFNGSKINEIQEIYKSYLDISGPDQAKAKVEARINEILVPYLPTKTKLTPNLEGTKGADNLRNWQIYEPGRMPRGQIYAIKDIPIILKLGTRGERMYLHGLFKVSASGKDRAILRSLKSASNVRVIVQYPQGVEVPSEDSQVHRDARRPFQIIDMRESPDGQINVYAREVTRP